MNKIILSDEHKYYVDGEVRPGVSEIINEFGFSNFSMVNNEILNSAINFGNVVHAVIKLSEQNKDSKFDNNHKKIQYQWRKFKDSVDLSNCLVDVKTNSKPTIANKLQIGAYKILLDEHNTKGLLVEQAMYSNVWGYCGTPDYANITTKIKDVFIANINLDSFKAYHFKREEVSTFENYFKALVQIYRLKQKENLL